MLTGGLLPFPRTGCVLYANAILPYEPCRRDVPNAAGHYCLFGACARAVDGGTLPLSRR